jgi:hypothetical protein
LKGTLAARPNTEQTTDNCQNADCGTEDPDTPGDGETPGNGDPDVPVEDNEISGSGDPDVPDTDTPDSSIAGDRYPVNRIRPTPMFLATARPTFL